MARYGHGEDGVTVLDRHDPSRGKAAAVPNAVDFVDDGHLGVAGQQKITMERMRRPLRNLVDRAASGNQRLANHLAAKNALPADLRRTASKQIYLYRFKIKNGKQILYGSVHGSSQ